MILTRFLIRMSITHFRSFERLFLESGTGLATSFHDYKIPIRIDYVFSSENLKSTYYQVDRSQNCQTITRFSEI